jgi:parallel beta-helix repeat protein
MLQQIKGCVPEKVLAALCAILFAAVCQPAQAATACVNPGGTSGCLATIGAAVSAAAAGDTIQVGAGTYAEAVVITKSLSLVGAGSASTIIDATGLPNGVFVNGTASAPNSGVTGVVVSGFTIKNANFQGILVENASNVTVWSNQVLSNDKSLSLSTASCPGMPTVLQSGEGMDCGEGINITGVDHSVVANNVIQNNSGGILISDDAGPTFENAISGNLVSNNPYDCGITIASHSGMGVYNNTVSGNQVSTNGLGLPGAGAGVGIFAPGPGSKTYSNVIVNNTLTGNGLPGVTMHNHAAVPGAPPVVFNDNLIIGNTISGNASDTDDAATSGSTGINIYSVAAMSGTVVTQNMISQETIGLAVNAPGTVVASLNNFLDTYGVDNIGSGTINATDNWWGCSGGPAVVGCSSVIGTVNSTPWLTSVYGAAQLPSPPTPPPSGTTGVMIVVSGPGGATSTSNTFQIVSSQVALNASHSTSTNAGGLSYSWTVSPGYTSAVSIVGASTATPTIQLASRGTYQVTLTVTDTKGLTATATITLQYV